MACSNCNGPAGPDSLRLNRGGDNFTPAIVEICEKCQIGTLMVKIVIARETTKEEFKYEGYLPAKCEK